MSAAPILNITKDGEQIRSVTIEGEAELGRSEGCLIRLDDRAISRKHALFTATPGGVQVEKKSDFAPLSVNGVECTRALLKEGDVIEIGPYLMRIAEQRTAAGHVSAPQMIPSAGIPVPAPSLEPEEPSNGEVSLGSFDVELPSMPDPLNMTSPQAEEVQSEPEAGSIPPSEQSFDPPDLNFNQNPEPAGEESQPPEYLQTSEVVGDEVPIEVPSFEPPLGDPSEQVDEDALTKLLPTEQLTASLEFADGLANVTHFDLEEEASIGRGKACDIVLKDKKASRKHAVIRRQGSTFVIRDLESLSFNSRATTSSELGILNSHSRR
jgi:pSer/pThr/pTyr-binding forkhead associated (FHA) protein